MAANRVLYFYLLLIAFFFFVLFDNYLFALLLLFLLLLPVLSLLLALPVRRAVYAQLDVDDEIVPKGRCAIRLTVENASPFPCALVRVHVRCRNALGRVGERYLFETFETVQLALNARKRTTLRPSLISAQCGRTDFMIRRVEVCDLMSLVCLPVPQRNTKRAAGSVFVLPELQSRTIPISDTSDIGLDSVSYSQEKPGGDPAEVFQLRDYRAGDSLHSVHWKLSSRMQKLIVREFGLPLNPSLHFLVELTEQASAAAAEEALGAMLAYSEYLLSREIVHGVSFLNEDGLLSTVTVTNDNSLATALHSLLALLAVKPWQTLMRFAEQANVPEHTHLICLVAGARWEREAQEAERLLASLLGQSSFSRITLMPDACPPEAARRLIALGCEVQLMDGQLPGAELVPEADE